MIEPLRVSEIFYSLQGESTRAGRPCAFVRLAGCNLRCAWCDTAYARQGGQAMTIPQILDRLKAWPIRLVEVTGGEPLLQAATGELLGALCDAGYEVLLETNGTVDLSAVDRRVGRIVDVKCPSSGEHDKTRWENLAALGPRDEVKFVVADRGDFDYACDVVRRHHLLQRCPVTVSPVFGRLQPATLAEWILQAAIDVRLGLQLHKLLWPDATRGR